MPEKGIILSALEREMLTDPEKLSARQKRNLTYRLKTRSAQIDQALKEIKLLIGNVPEDSIKENISNETLDDLMSILESALQILGPWPIGRIDGEEIAAFRVFGRTVPQVEQGKCAIVSFARSVSCQEIELNRRLKEHFSAIRFYVDPCTPDPVCRDPAFIENLDAMLVKKMGASGEPFNMSFNVYWDETGFDENGHKTRSNSTVNIDQLSQIRWRPRDLLECLELPPVLTEKVIGKEEKGAKASDSEEPK